MAGAGGVVRTGGGSRMGRRILRSGCWTRRRSRSVARPVASLHRTASHSLTPPRDRARAAAPLDPQSARVPVDDAPLQPVLAAARLGQRGQHRADDRRARDARRQRCVPSLSCSRLLPPPLLMCAALADALRLRSVGDVLRAPHGGVRRAVRARGAALRRRRALSDGGARPGLGWVRVLFARRGGWWSS